MGLYGLPFDGIKGVRAEMVRVKALEARLLKDANTLQEKVSALLGFGKPIALRRVTNKSYAPLVWRDMTRHKSRQASMTGLDCELGRNVLASLDDGSRKQLLDIEFNRIHLNHAAGLLQYELARLKRLEGEFNVWRQMMRDVNQH
jgi:hypothetical protein